MERQDIAALLYRLLESVRTLESRIQDVGDLPRISPQQQEAANAVVVAYTSLKEVCYGKPLHHKTRTKLFRLVDQADALAELCRLLARSTLPAAFDLLHLRTEIAAMCWHQATSLEVAADYYARERHDSQIRFDAGVPGSAAPGVPNASAAGTPQGLVSPAGPLTDFDRLALLPDNTTSHEYASRRAPKVKVGPTEIPVYFGTTRAANSDINAQPEWRFLNGRGAGMLTGC